MKNRSRAKVTYITFRMINKLFKSTFTRCSKTFESSFQTLKLALVKSKLQFSKVGNSFEQLLPKVRIKPTQVVFVKRWK